MHFYECTYQWHFGIFHRGERTQMGMGSPPDVRTVSPWNRVITSHNAGHKSALTILQIQILALVVELCLNVRDDCL